MKRFILIFIGFLIIIIGVLVAVAMYNEHVPSKTNKSPNLSVSQQANKSSKEKKMQIHLTANGQKVTFELNDSQASQDLAAQLPLQIELENYANNEKIFYPPKKLHTTSTPRANAKTGDLAYYAPWGDVVIFYDDFGTASGLYSLGHVVGHADLKRLRGQATLELKE